MNLKLQTASPSDNDIFEGKSHQTVAIKMAEVIKDTDINIIGLEGELGTGKSTIIKFLMNNLKDDFHFITFDAERYHYGSTKKSLIEIIYKGMLGASNSINSELEKHKDKALGNVVEYTKKVNSRISWWTISFILCTLLSVQMVRYFLVDLNAFLNPLDSKRTLSSWIIIIEMLGLISPILLLLILACVRWYRKRKGSLTDAFISIGDLFKKNSTDTISEKWLVSREVGTIELTEALEGFTKNEAINADCRFILIIDNLDRISGDKVKELWSDMELIAGVTHEQFRVVVPYSARQVAKSLAVEGHSGQEFIAKRIPISFSVPPLISAGWQSAFSVLWRETVSEVNDISCHETAQLLERWRPAEYPQITPRLMKKLVNDIHILALTVPGEEPYRHILIALYILAVRYGGINIHILLRVQTENDGEISQEPVLDDKLKATARQLAKVFRNDTNRWSEYLISVHYQTGITLARSELIDIPLISAINAHNQEQLQKLIRLWGFQTAWERCTNRFAISDWFIAAASLPDVALKSVIQELQQGVLIMDAQYALNSRESYNGDLSESIYKLIRTGYIHQSSFMERQWDFIISDLDDAQGKEKNDDGIILELLKDANIYSQIFDLNILDKIESHHIDGEFYVNFLMKNASVYESLHINDIKLNDEATEKMLRCYLENDVHGDIFIPEIIRHIGLSTSAVTRVINNPSGAGLDLTLESLHKLKQRIPIADYASFRKIILNAEWHSANLIPYYASQSTIIGSYPIEHAVQKMAHMIAINTYSEIELYAEYTGNGEFSTLLSNYLVYFKSFDTVMSAIEREDIAPLVINAIGIIFKENKVHRMNPINFGKVHYPLLKEYSPKLNILEAVISRQGWFIEHLNLSELISLSPIFVQDIMESNSLKDSCNKFIELARGSFYTTEALHASFIKIEINIEIIIKHMSEAGDSVIISDVRAFSDWYRNASLDLVQSGKNVHLFWLSLNDDQNKEVIKELEDIIYERDTAIERRVMLIHDFLYELKFNESDATRERRAIAALFSASKDDELLKSWLDNQNFHFNKWNTEDSDTVAKYIINNQDDFPIICGKSVFIKNRIKLINS